MLAAATGITSLLGNIANIVGDVFNAKTKAQVTQAEIEAAIKQAIINQGTIEIQSYVQLAVEQAKTNQILAQAGKLGWREWLGKWVTIIFIANLSIITIITLSIFFGTLLGVNQNILQLAAHAYPKDFLNLLWEVEGGLLGLYIARGTEKWALFNSTQSFDVETFFKEYRKTKGGLSQEEVNNLQLAINKATSNKN